MKYELTKDLETGNGLIDSEHRQLFQAVNTLMDACSVGKGRDKIKSTSQFLQDYVIKHFRDEEDLQKTHQYPGYISHRQFHGGYAQTLNKICWEIEKEGPTIPILSKLNQHIGVLVNHIRTEDKKLAEFLRNKK
ncbi:MAG: hemerythrin family protein [Clostridium sp.]|nr:hemerythrin family protein [Clostridium sp.]